MRNRILQAISEGWYLPVFEHILMKDFFKRILTIYNVLDVFELDEKSTVALYGSNSQNWIAIYLACLLKGVRLLIIHPNINKFEAVHIQLLTNTNHVFIDEELISKELGSNIFLRTLINIELLSVVYEKNDQTYFKTLAEIIVSSEETLNVDLRSLQAVIEDIDIESSIITATSGTENGEPKWVESSTESVTDLLNRAMSVVPFGRTIDKVFSRVEFADSHYLTVLLPFVTGCRFITNHKDAEIVIEDTTSIEDIWRKNVNYLYSKRVLSFLFSISWMKWLFKKIATLKMKSYYGKKLEALIIYNSVVNDELLLTLVGKLPIYTTYGSQETNQLVAINNYSTAKKRSPGAVGLPGLSFITTEDELEISGDTLFNNYVGDESYTREVRFRDNYVTGDIGFDDSNSNVLFVYGRKLARIQNEYKLPIQLDKLERIIKSIPYIEEVLFVKRHNKLALLVYPDVNFAETKKLGYLRFEELMKVYLNKINTEIGEHIDGLIILDDPLLKTHDNKICRYFYS